MRAALLETTSYPCPYLDGRTARMEQFLVYSLSLEEHEFLLAHGYRHFGDYYFRPDCRECRRCIPVRFPVAGVTDHRSWRRLRKKTDSLSIEIDDLPSIDEAFALYKSHKQRFNDGEEPSVRVFEESFFSMHSAAHLLTIRDNESLVAVAHFDETEQALSAVYTYYDDAKYAWASPGKLAIITLIRRAADRRRKWLYLGYYVHGNRAMSYKAGYQPLEYSAAGGIWMRPDQAYSELRFEPGASLLIRR